MAVTKTFSVTVSFTRADKGLKYNVGGSGNDAKVKIQAELSEDDLEFTGLREAVLKGLKGVLPITCGIANAHIVGEVVES